MEGEENGVETTTDTTPKHTTLDTPTDTPPEVPSEEQDQDSPQCDGNISRTPTTQADTSESHPSDPEHTTSADVPQPSLSPLTSTMPSLPTTAVSINDGHFILFIVATIEMEFLVPVSVKLFPVAIYGYGNMEGLLNWTGTGNSKFHSKH